MNSLADIVIVNWNSEILLSECINSIATYPKGVGRVIVVDNGSTDESANVGNLFPNLTLIRLEENQGFARACNVGASNANAPYILFLNPDTRFLDNESLPKLLQMLDGDVNGDIGIAGIRLVDEAGVTQRSCANFTNVRTFIGVPFGLDQIMPSIFTPLFADFDYSESRNVDQAIGAYFVVRSATFKQLKGFDERFFVYWEEVDFCLRAKIVGWRTHYFAESVAFHKGGGTSDRVKAKRLFYQLRSRILYALKHFGSFEGGIVLVMTAVFEPIARIARSLMRGSLQEAKDTLSGYRMFWQSIPDIFEKHNHFKDSPKI